MHTTTWWCTVNWCQMKSGGGWGWSVLQHISEYSLFPFSLLLDLHHQHDMMKCVVKNLPPDRIVWETWWVMQHLTRKESVGFVIVGIFLARNRDSWLSNLFHVSSSTSSSTSSDEKSFKNMKQLLQESSCMSFMILIFNTSILVFRFISFIWLALTDGKREPLKGLVRN